jgi:hypothetical protein
MLLLVLPLRAIYLGSLLRSFQWEQTFPTEVWEDNAACISLSAKTPSVGFALKSSIN